MADWAGEATAAFVSAGFSRDKAAQLTAALLGRSDVNETTTCAVCRQTAETITCVPCRNRIAGLLKQLPEQYCYLAMSRQRDQAGSDGRGSKRLHAPLPGREDTLNPLGPWARQNVTDAQDQVGPVPVLAVLET